MTSNSDDRYTQYVHQRVNTNPADHNTNEKKNNNDIVNRRHSLAHTNFRKAIDRSLSLPQGNDESNNIPTRSRIYFIKVFFICLFIILTGSLVRFMWSFNRHK